VKLGLFLMPVHPPERDIRQGACWDLDVIEEADRVGFDEAWIGEHFTNPWEPCPAPDILISQALARTERIRLAPGSHILPYHHPAELAHRVAYLDHLSEGRLMLGIGAGGLPSDLQLFSVDQEPGQSREMMWEALDIMVKLWSAEGPFEYTGKYWRVNRPGVLHGTLQPHLKPLQLPHPPIGVSAFSPRSDTLTKAGSLGLMPMSLNLNMSYLAGHWEAYALGADGSGRTPSRSVWRVTREVFVADTDAQAERLAVDGFMGRSYRDCWLPLYRQFKWLDLFKHDPSVPDSDVTPSYLARHNWIVGSPSTVVEKLGEFYHCAGGFGTLLVLCYDYLDNPEPWMQSLGLLSEVVLPKLKSSLGNDGEEEETAHATN
jgi:alkanesulfonate monooxygenase SsuD/methylene tetrahydromethanopterin reductase-like flavin-dependent oxidoreductase (luciferase family)